MTADLSIITTALATGLAFVFLIAIVIGLL
jgi:hypothetical protein